ncbi:MAG: Phosphatase YwpJ [Phycisphaerae bacterium]|nr:Phosphatase YwpJ [Phycisphaerae bacterium]
MIRRTDSLLRSLVAIDLDGTLLNTRHVVSPENRAALHRAHQAGIRIVLCTGRSLPETRAVMSEIGLDLDASVTVSGAIVTDLAADRTIEYEPMTLDTAQRATDWFQARGYAVLWLNDRDREGRDGYVFDGPRRHAAYDRWLQMAPCRVDARPWPSNGLTPPARISIIDEIDALETMALDFAAKHRGQVAFNVIRAPVYSLTVIECFAPAVNKWSGVLKLCRRWNIDPRRTAAVGDDMNDIPMITHAGVGIAMGNAQPAVKAAAGRLTGTNDEHGVAQLLDAILAGAC